MRMRWADGMAGLLDGRPMASTHPCLGAIDTRHRRMAPHKTSSGLAEGLVPLPTGKPHKARPDNVLAAPTPAQTPSRPGCQGFCCAIGLPGRPSSPPRPQSLVGEPMPMIKKRLALEPSESQSEGGSASDRSRWEQPAVSYQLTE